MKRLIQAAAWFFKPAHQLPRPPQKTKAAPVQEPVFQKPGSGQNRQIRTWLAGFFGAPGKSRAAAPPVPPPRKSPPQKPGEPRPIHAAPRPAPAPAPAPATVRSQPPPPLSSDADLHLPLSVLVPSLPLELQHLIKSDRIVGAIVALPKELVLAQLSQGFVRVTFGQIRRSAPNAFADGSKQDGTLVQLPLQELVARLGSQALQRRSQKKVQVPAQISDPFGGQDCWSVAFVDEAATAAAQGPRPGILPPAPPVGQGPASPSPRIQSHEIQRPAPFAAEVAATPKVPRPSQAATRIPAATPDSDHPIPDEKPGVESLAAEAAAEASTVSPPRSVSPSHEADLELLEARAFPAGETAALRREPEATPTQKAGPKAEPVPASTEPERVEIALAALAAALPPALKDEIRNSGLLEAKLALPIHEVESGLKRGRLAFTWQNLRAFITPAPPAGICGHDLTEVELPLVTLAVAFFARQKEKASSAGAARLQDGTTISQLLGPAQAGGMANAPGDAFEPALEPDQPRSSVDPAQTPTPITGIQFTDATPDEIVAAAVQLKGVEASLIALPDGLLLASRLGSSLDGDMLAARLPEAYSTMRSFTKELRLGELSDLTFTAGNKAWKILRINGLFFAAVGRAGVHLPGDELAQLAAGLKAWEGD